MIKSFRDENAEAIFKGEAVRWMALDLQNAIRRKLKYLNNYYQRGAGDLKRRTVDVARIWGHPEA